VSTYLQIAGLFGMLSLLSIGGGNAVLPEMHMDAVKGHHWMTDSQFADIFSISQTAPGPSILIVTLVGYGAGLSVGGVPGAIIGGLIATAAMILPAASLMYAVTLFWQKAQKSKLRYAVEKGFAPLTVGLIMATSLVMSRAADRLAGVSDHGDLHRHFHLHQDESADRGRRGGRARQLRHRLTTPAGSR